MCSHLTVFLEPDGIVEGVPSRSGCSRRGHGEAGGRLGRLDHAGLDGAEGGGRLDVGVAGRHHVVAGDGGVRLPDLLVHVVAGGAGGGGSVASLQRVVDAAEDNHIKVFKLRISTKF